MRTFQALILALTGFFLLEQLWSGGLLNYANQRYAFLILVTGIGFIALAQVIFQERKPRAASLTSQSHSHDFSSVRLLWLVLPLVLGMLISERAPEANTLQTKGVTLISPFLTQGQSGSAALERPSVQRTVLDWMRAFESQTDPTALNGEEVDLIGFVYHDPRQADTLFVVSRYTVTESIANATAVGIAVNWKDAAHLKDNLWVRVQGKLTNGQSTGQAVPVINAEQVDVIPEPAQPYLFP
jgi:putative membrane protein